MSLVDYLAKNECREVAFNRSSWFVDFLARNLQQIDIRNPILVYQEVELNRSREYKKI